MTKLFVIDCNKEQRFRIRKRDTGTVHNSNKRVVLEMFTNSGWEDIEYETTTGTTDLYETVERFVKRTMLMYGAPRPTRIIPYEEAGIIEVERFREKYGLDEYDVAIDTTEVEPIDNE